MPKSRTAQQRYCVGIFRFQPRGHFCQIGNVGKDPLCDSSCGTWSCVCVFVCVCGWVQEEPKKICQPAPAKPHSGFTEFLSSPEPGPGPAQTDRQTGSRLVYCGYLCIPHRSTYCLTEALNIWGAGGESRKYTTTEKTPTTPPLPTSIQSFPPERAGIY